MAWTSILDLVTEALPVARSLPAGLTMREASAAVAARQWPDRLTDGTEALVNVAALTYAGRERLQVHSIRPAASRLVSETDVHSLPGEPPQMLRRPWLVESSRQQLGEALWGSTVALAGYPLEDGRIVLIGIQWPDGAAVGVWSPRWEERELPDGGTYAGSVLEGVDADALGAWTSEAARWAVTLALLLDSEGAPLRQVDERSGEARRRGAAARGVSVRHVYLDERRAALTRPGGEGAPVDAEGRLLQSTWVRGHIRRQPHGTGRRETKLLYIAGHEARRWVLPGVRPVAVGARHG